MKLLNIFSSLLLVACAYAAPVSKSTQKHKHSPHSSEKSVSVKKIVSGDLDAYESPSGSFEDGKIACSDFPSGNGVISLSWLGLGGWASIMDANGDTSSSCEDGEYCSYACQPGMAKTQWPSDQPSDGRSVGGLYCKGGYLYRTNTDADNLCAWGENSTTVKSSLDKDVAICQTDYPGSENMVVPTVLEAGSSSPLTTIDEDTYYQWQGKKTSAQFYVNNAGVSVDNGCIWGSASKGVGNYAPLVIGAGYTDGKAYISLIPNPNNKNSANFNVEITAADGSEVDGECSYSDGSFSGDSDDGCTVTVVSGSAVITFS
ncbi:SUN protein uth1 [Brettanomyces bruxellensis]|uniref:SUN protein uth1 n=1 Tax=Dekkera bruxellensis TaxID=5007 RepID=A0A8H6BL36_DEKBR|nr:SUN protein uth1 [Brettanomyces bruxellensis]KAF6013831.1 SUN protein uth1 [Brettanomyces bruxellensis]QOU23006.1 SUN protein uth1 [Brettanomyces bruxellensis]